MGNKWNEDTAQTGNKWCSNTVGRLGLEPRTDGL